tara:strand:- start:1068 stop:2156 length:1089 start_codon:yes stop_codon:yes gene_type:complete
MIIAPIKNLIDYFFGRGEHSVFVPVMDGPFKPNEFLDNIKLFSSLDSVDNLEKCKTENVCSSGKDLFSFKAGGKLRKVHEFDSDITAIAFNEERGILAVALVTGEVFTTPLSKIKLNKEFSDECITSMAFVEDLLLYTKGSTNFQSSQWKYDLMSKEPTGSISVSSLDGNNPKVLASNLAWPAGIINFIDGQICVSEAWEHRVCFYKFNKDEITLSLLQQSLDKLPAYPGKLFFDLSKNQIWVSFFAPRNQLVEFVLKEDEYRNKMVDQIPEDLWISPTYRSGKSMQEPLQHSGIKTMGYLKPWAPAFSYGLFVNFDINLRALSSFHSRTNGSFHGTTSLIIDEKNNFFVSSRGDNKIGMWK